YVLAPHVLEQLDHHLAVRELADDGAPDGKVQVLRHLLREARVGVAREHHQPIERRVGHFFTSLVVGWGGRIGTLVCRNQNPVPEPAWRLPTRSLQNLEAPNLPNRRADAARFPSRRSRASNPATATGGPAPRLRLQTRRTRRPRNPSCAPADNGF